MKTGDGETHREFESHTLRQKETAMLVRELPFLFVLFSLPSSLFPLLSNCRFQIREKSEQRKEAVSALRMIGISQAAQSGISPEMPLSHPCRIASGMMQILS